MQPNIQPFTNSRLFNRLFNRFNNRLYRVNDFTFTFKWIHFIHSRENSCDFDSWTWAWTSMLNVYVRLRGSIVNSVTGNTHAHTDTHTHCSVWTTKVVGKYTARCIHSRQFYTPFTRHSRLSIRLYNRFDNRLYRVNKHPTDCQTGCQTGLTTGLTTGCIVYTNIYPVIKPIWQPVWQQVVSCKRGFIDRNVEQTAVNRQTFYWHLQCKTASQNYVRVI